MGGIVSGIGNILGFKKSPPPPDYVGAARETAEGNLEAARAATTANRVNQYTPYGNLTYQRTGKDDYGNDIWRADVTLSPAEQQKLDQQNALGIGLAGSQNKALEYVNQNLENPFDTSKLASVGINPGETYSDAIMRRLQPQMDRANKQLDTTLANQGIPVGSEAWKAAKEQQAMAQNDQLTSAVVGGFDKGLAARQQGLQEAAYLRNEPINLLSSLRTGSQVSNPNFINTPQQATTSGPDILGATQMGYNAQLGASNAANAQAGNLMGAAAQIGAAFLSDIRVKENIEFIGKDPQSGLNIYGFEYANPWKAIGGYGRHIGHMAQEVEQIYPHAVIEIDGIKHVNYGAIYGN
jgi:hypothetical protein